MDLDQKFFKITHNEAKVKALLISCLPSLTIEDLRLDVIKIVKEWYKEEDLNSAVLFDDEKPLRKTKIEYIGQTNKRKFTLGLDEENIAEEPANKKRKTLTLDLDLYPPTPEDLDLELVN